MTSAALLSLLVLTGEPSLTRPVATYSIVARDPATGDLGVAVQSHWFSVGSAVPWAESGVGAVATQSFVEVSYGPLGLELMRAGKSAPEALKSLLASDGEEAVRQVAMVDAEGRVQAHTGSRCIDAAGHQLGTGYSVQANLMGKATVWPAMARAYEAAAGSFAERLLAALQAGEREGGDIRGRQSAAMLIVKGKPSGRPWADRLVDLRVEDAPDPLAELARLLRLQTAYDAMNQGDALVAKNDFAGALAAYTKAAERAPEVVELVYWQAVTLAQAGKIDQALPLFAQVFAKESRWRELTPRLVKSGLLDEKYVKQVLGEGAAK
jgi:uncharacterized Ntn-hydrolase superfamily protein